MYTDDDFFHCKWSPSSPRRCDRGQSFCTDSATASSASAPPPTVAPLSKFISFDHGNFLSCCTEELGSESCTSGAGPAFDSPMSFCHQSIFCKDHTASAPAEVPRIWTSSPQQHECHPCRCRQRLPPSGASSGAKLRTFPPPLQSLLCERPLMKSIKSKGRFILKKIENVSRSMFRSMRKNGRLRLDLLYSSPCDGVDDECYPFFPNKPACLSLSAASVYRHHYLLNIPPATSFNLNCSSSFESRKPTLSYETSRPSPQALAMLMQPRSNCNSGPQSPLASSSFPHSFAHIPKINAIASTHFLPNAIASPLLLPQPPRVVALVHLHPAGLGLIILEFGQSKNGNFVTLHGVYFLKGFGLQSCSRDGTMGLPFITNLCGIGDKMPKGKLFPQL